MLEKVKMTKRNLKTPVTRGNAGFTAIEIAMVAAVIAILSLIVLPIFRNRVEDAKIAAAQADLSALMKAQQVVRADIDAYARLEDLDNVELFGYQADPPDGVDKEVPFFKYVKPSPTVSPDPASRQVLSSGQRNTLGGTPDKSMWKGPYVAFQNHIKYVDFRNAVDYPLGNYIRRAGSADYQMAMQDFPTGALRDSDENRIPVDPWGNPYLFFAPTGNAANPTVTQAFASAVIYSLGPNGLPGDGSQGGNAAAYKREFTLTNPGDDGALGKGDDLMVEF